MHPEHGEIHPSSSEHLRLKSGHDLCPNQRSVAFHASLLQGVGVMTSFMVSGTLPMDFFLIEYEICTASLAKFIVDAALAHAKSFPAAACRSVHLVTHARNVEETLAAFSFRRERAAEVRGALRPLVADRQLKRAKSASNVELEEIMATQPCAPPLPQKLAEYLL